MLKILIVAATLTGCTGDDDDASGLLPGETDDIEWRADLFGIGDDAAVRGAANVMYAVGAPSFTVGVEILFDATMVERPWHVHAGSCARPGAIVGAPESYPALSTNDRGTDTVTVTISAPLEPGGEYHVDVHAAATEIIACGELRVIGS